MRRRIYQFLAAGIFLLCTAAAPTGQARAQQEQGTPPEAGVPDIRLRGPEPQGSEQPAPGDPQAGHGEPEMQHGCPDRGRPLQLLV
jgi:hypothetical protein